MYRYLTNRMILMLVLAFSWTGLSAQEGPIGWASFGDGTTGGEGGETILVTNRNQLAAAVTGSDPRIILIQDTIEMILYERMDVGSNKTILGVGQNAMIRFGGFEIKGDNVIIQNLAIGDSYDGDWEGKTHSTDALTIYGENVWIDHCDLFASADGLLDIRADNGKAANFVTVSNTRFSNHNKVMLFGSSNEETEDRGKLKTTIVHCWFDGTIERGLYQRMPRTRFADVHILNNYYEDIGLYCNAARFESDLVVEANYYRTSHDPHFIEDKGLGIEDPELRAFDNIYELSSGRKESEGFAFEPATFYDYTPMPAEQVPGYVMNEAGRFNPPGNTGPIAVTDTIVPEGPGALMIDPLSNDLDTDGGTLKLARLITTGAGQGFVRDNKVIYGVPVNAPDRDTMLYELVDTQGGIDTGMVVFINATTSIGNVPARAGTFRISPNPAHDRTSVSIEGLKEEAHDPSITIIGIDGKILRGVVDESSIIRQDEKSLHFNIETGSLPGGVYSVVIRNQRSVYQQKFIVIH